MKYLFLLLILFFSLTCLASEADLSYTISRKDSTTLLVKVAFTGNGKGNTILHLPNEWASQHALYTAISDITAISKHTVVKPTGRPDIYSINYSPGRQVIFSYLLHKDWPGELKYPLYFRSVIQPDFFYFEGYSGIVYPELSDTTHIKCHIAYKGFVKDDFIGNSFFSNKKEGSFTVSQDDLLNSIFCAGKFRSKTTIVNGHQLVVALTGKPAFSDKAVFSSIVKIILAERRFWNDAGPDYYLTIFLPLYDQGNTGGTAHYHAFSLFQSADLGLTGNLLPMIAHEYFHNWLGLGLKMPAPDEPYKWFSEGFTEYYSYRILYETGIISEKDFFKKVNAYLRDYFLSPYFSLANQELIGRYWENSELKLLSYRRGFVEAFMLNSQISEKHEKSLDELLRELYLRSFPARIFSNKLFDNLVCKYSDQKTLTAINQSNVGDNKPLARLLFTNQYYQMDTLKVDKVFDLGFNYEASKAAGKIVGLTAGSNAAKAGLAENMKLSNKYSIWFGNTEKPAMIGVIEHGQEKSIQYIPQLRVDKRIPQLIIKK